MFQAFKTALRLDIIMHWVQLVILLCLQDLKDMLATAVSDPFVIAVFQVHDGRSITYHYIHR